MSAAFRGQREEVEQMKNCLRVLSQAAPPTAGEAELATDQQDREGALELLADLCENMDNAAGTLLPQPSPECPTSCVAQPCSLLSWIEPPTPPSLSLLLVQEQSPPHTPPSPCSATSLMSPGTDIYSLICLLLSQGWEGR